MVHTYVASYVHMHKLLIATVVIHAGNKHNIARGVRYNVRI